MKRRTVLFFLILNLLTAALPVCADEELFNPSVYSAGQMTADLPSFWIANYIELQEYLKKYPDLQCEHFSNVLDTGNFDQIICESVNNKRARDVIINFYFSGDHAGMTGLQEVVFTIGTPKAVDIQEVLEQYWLPGAIPWHESSDEFYNGMTSLMFRTSETILRFDLPDLNSEWFHYTTVDLWDRNASRMGVG